MKIIWLSIKSSRVFNCTYQKYKQKCVIKFSACKLKIHITDIIQVFKISDVQMDASTVGHVECMWTQPGVQMDASTEGYVDCTWTELGVHINASTEGLVAASEHLGPPFKWILKQRDLLKNPNNVLCSLWMSQQMDLLLHTDSTRILWYVFHGCLNRWTSCCTWTLL